MNDTTNIITAIIVTFVILLYFVFDARKAIMNYIEIVRNEILEAIKEQSTPKQ